MSFHQSCGLLMKCVVLSFVASSLSVAQAAPGDHIRTGSLTIVPSVGFGMNYRSNAFRSESNGQGTGVAVITPGLQANLDSPDVKFGMGVNYGIQKYLFLSGGDSATRADRISALDRFNNISIHSKLDVLPAGQVGLAVGYGLVVHNNPSDIAVDSNDPYTTQFGNTVNVGIPIRPGPALSIAPGIRYGWTQYFVPSSDEVREPFNSKQSYGPSLAIDWKFLPRTKALVKAEYMLNRWKDDSPGSEGSVSAVNDSGLGKVSAGIQGRITERLKLVMSVGSGFGSFSNSTNLGLADGLLANLGVGYDVSDAHSVTAGVRKTFFDSFFTNSVSAVSLQATWAGNYGEKLSSNLSLGTRFEHYDGPITRNDQVTQVGLSLAYAVNSWSNVGVKSSWMQRSSPGDTGGSFDDINAGIRLNLVY